MKFNNIQQLFAEAQKRSKKRNHRCLYDGCENFAIKSHAQQKSGPLKFIAENNRVYSLNSNYYQIFSNPDNYNPLSLTNINKSTTFKGFCEKHDNDLFFDIENKELEYHNLKQACLLFYRAICYEYTAKRDTYFIYEFVIENGRELLSNYQVENLYALKSGIKLFLDRDFVFYKQRILEILSKEKYMDLSINWKTLKKDIGVSCSTLINPELTDYVASPYYNVKQPTYLLLLLPEKHQSNILLMWFREFDKEMKEIRKQLTKNKYFPLINRLIFYESEDFCIQPSLWVNLNQEVQNNITTAMKTKITPIVFEPPNIIYP